MIDFTNFPNAKDVFYIVCLLLIIIYSFIHYGPRKLVGENREGLISGKDHFYRLLILSIVLIVVITSKFGDNDIVVGYIGFSGTIISIILGLIAIFYSFITNNRGSSINERLTLSSEKISQEVTRLSDLKKVMLKEFRDINSRLDIEMQGKEDVLNTIPGIQNKKYKSAENIDSSPLLSIMRSSYDDHYFADPILFIYALVKAGNINKAEKIIDFMRDYIKSLEGHDTKRHESVLLVSGVFIMNLCLNYNLITIDTSGVIKMSKNLELLFESESKQGYIEKLKHEIDKEYIE